MNTFKQFQKLPYPCKFFYLLFVVKLTWKDDIEEPLEACISVENSIFEWFEYQAKAQDIVTPITLKLSDNPQEYWVGGILSINGKKSNMQRILDKASNCNREYANFLTQLQHPSLTIIPMKDNMMPLTQEQALEILNEGFIHHEH